MNKRVNFTNNGKIKDLIKLADKGKSGPDRLQLVLYQVCYYTWHLVTSSYISKSSPRRVSIPSLWTLSRFWVWCLCESSPSLSWTLLILCATSISTCFSKSRERQTQVKVYKTRYLSLTHLFAQPSPCLTWGRRGRGTFCRPGWASTVSLCSCSTLFHGRSPSLST